MNYISVKEAAIKFNISERRIQQLCEMQRIPNCTMLSGIWLIPNDVKKPIDERFSVLPDNKDIMSLSELCKTLSISIATGRNWIKLGKIIPKYNDKKNPYFERSYVESISKDLKSGNNDSLKNRRNKKFISGNSLYNSYVSEKCKNLLLVKNVLEQIKSQNILLSEEIIGYLLADCAIHLLFSRKESNVHKGTSLFSDYLSGNLTFRESELIDNLINDKNAALCFLNNNPTLFKNDYFYEAKEDILGLLYISCKNIGNRKATGAYYTPTAIVKNVISTVPLNENAKILDPCCGTGNFLLQLPESIPFTNIYGIDIDPLSIKITKINMALRYPDSPINIINSHISECDFLMHFPKKDFSVIIGNPPWGFDFSESQKKQLKEKYKTAVNTNIESYDIFIERSLELLSENGQLAFVLPEALLTVKIHTTSRTVISDNTKIKEIKYLGNAFDRVHCPCIILRLQKKQDEHSTIGLLVDDGNRKFEIRTERAISPEYFSFLTNDEEYRLIEKIKNKKNCDYLLGNADFALGIVTGNNKKYVFSEAKSNTETVLRGVDIYKYKIIPANTFIDFQPEKFQQVAPIELYRVKEKLFYRFICNQLVFAYDNNQTLSLNSCNIVIPKIASLKIKYIMAILNSRVAQFLFKKEFNSIKVLRSHVENIPLPIVSNEIQTDLIHIADLISSTADISSIKTLYNEIDEKICKLFNLSVEEQNIIKNAVDRENKFFI